MRICLILILPLLLAISVDSRLCPPSCKPPKKTHLCWRYVVSAECTNDVTSLSETDAHCGCLWKNYLQTIRSHDTDARKCMTWASSACSSLDKVVQIRLGGNGSSLLSELNEETLFEEKVSVSTKEALPLIDVLRKILKLVENSHQLRSYKITSTGEIAKSRKRNGVNFKRGHKSHKLGRIMQPKTSTVKEKKRKKSAPTKNLVGPIIIGKWKRGILDLTPINTPMEKPLSSKMTVVGPPPIKPTQSNNPTGSSKNVSITLTSKDIKNSTNRVSFREWMDFNIPADQFKLIVFGIILLLNILVVLVLIFCRTNDSYQVVKESKPKGDLNAHIYKPIPPEPPEPPKKKTRGWDVLINKCRQSIKERKEKKRRAENPFLLMEEVNQEDFAQGPKPYADVVTSSPYYVNSGFHRESKRISQRSSRGLYDSIGDDSTFLDDTYEDPVSPMRPPTSTPQGPPRNSSFKSDSQGSSPIKYFSTSFEDQKNKTISFTLPAGTFVTLQDRVDGGGTTDEEKKEETGRGTSNASQNGDES
ncbi:hypothetical protein ACF0H5_018944 [Mactra antiquata]